MVFTVGLSSLYINLYRLSLLIRVGIDAADMNHPDHPDPPIDDDLAYTNDISSPTHQRRSKSSDLQIHSPFTGCSDLSQLLDNTLEGLSTIQLDCNPPLQADNIQEEVGLEKGKDVEEDKDQDAKKDRKESEKSCRRNTTIWLNERLGASYGCTEHESSPDEDGEEDEGLSMEEMVEYWQEHGVRDVLSSDDPKETTESNCNWRAVLAGEDDAPPPPLALHLANSEQRVKATEMAFDIDSLIGHVKCLSAFQYGIKISFDPMVTLNLTKPLHVRVNSYTLHKTPHLCFGSSMTNNNLRLYVFFPKIKQEGDGEGGTFTTMENRRIWIDELFLPASHAICPPIVQHHLPHSYAHGRGKMLARSTENKSKVIGRVETIHYLLHGRYLKDIWQHMLRTVKRRHLQDFSDMFLIVNGKNLKMSYQDEKFRRCRRSFVEDLCMHLNMEKLNLKQTWVDVGREVVSCDEAKTFLWKACCLRSWARSFSPKGSSAGVSSAFYHWNMTRDAGSMTVELRAKNPLRRGGIVYAQRYNIVKELWDAQGTYPFTSKALEGLLVPDSLSHLWQTVGGAPNTWTPRHSWQIYEASKERVRHSMMGAEPNTFGVREEYRITWDLFISLDMLKHWPSKIDICPFYQLSTWETLLFVRWQLNRWLSCMEYLQRRSMVKDRSPEDIIVGTLLAHCIRAGINNEALSQDGNLWKDEWHTEKGLFRHGMNFEYLLQRYGIAWLPARKFNWEKLHLIPEVEENCSFQNNAMKASYRKRHMAVKAVSILHDQIASVASHLSYPDNEERHTQILEMLRRICYQEFVKQVFECCKDELKTNVPTNGPLEGAGGLCIDLLQFVLKDHPLLHKLKPSKNNMTWAERIQVLFDWDDGYKRGSWEQYQYRQLTQHAYRCIERAAGSAIAQEWRMSLGSKGCCHFWILPHYGRSQFFCRRRPNKENRQRKNAGLPSVSYRLWLSAVHECTTPNSQVSWSPEEQDKWMVGVIKCMRGPAEPILLRANAFSIFLAELHDVRISVQERCEGESRDHDDDAASRRGAARPEPSSVDFS